MKKAFLESEKRDASKLQGTPLPGSGKKSWHTPTLMEVDYRETRLGYTPAGTDGPIYS